MRNFRREWARINRQDVVDSILFQYWRVTGSCQVTWRRKRGKPSYLEKLIRTTVVVNYIGNPLRLIKRNELRASIKSTEGTGTQGECEGSGMWATGGEIGERFPLMTVLLSPFSLLFLFLSTLTKAELKLYHLKEDSSSSVDLVSNGTWQGIPTRLKWESNQEWRNVNMSHSAQTKHVEGNSTSPGSIQFQQFQPSKLQRAASRKMQRIEKRNKKKSIPEDGRRIWWCYQCSCCLQGSLLRRRDLRCCCSSPPITSVHTQDKRKRESPLDEIENN